MASRISRREVIRRNYDLSTRLNQFYTLNKIVSARLYKHKPDDKIFNDDTFVDSSLDEIKKLAGVEWSTIDKMHGKNKTKD